MQSDPDADEGDPEEVNKRRHLPQHERAHHGGGGREKREQERERRSGQARHRKLVADVRDHRRRKSDADPGEQQGRACQGLRASSGRFERCCRPSPNDLRAVDPWERGNLG